MKIIKKVTTTGVVAVMVMWNSMAFAVENVTGTVNTETLRLRKDASVESSVLELLSKDDKVDILEEKDGWYKVKFKDYTGYVSKEFISTKGEVKTQINDTITNNKSEPNANEDGKSNTVEGTVDIKQNQAKTISNAKLYILPLINSNVVSNLSKDKKVGIINVNGGWAYVKTNEFCGWIRLDKITVETTDNSKNTDSVNNKQTENAEENNSENDNKETVKSEQQSSKKEEFQSRTAYIKEVAVNLRSNSSTNSEIITTLSQNTQINLVGEDNNWYKVEVNGKTGYILKTLISNQKVEVTSRSAVANRTTNTEKITSNANATSQTQQKTQATQSNQTEPANQNKNATITASNTANTNQNTSSKGADVVAYAKQLLGCKYVYGGSGPSVFDCSGFTMYVYKHFGYSMSHSAVAQASVGRYVSKSELQPGDLIIFNNESNTSIGHVGIYVGGGNFIHASSGSGKIIIASLSYSYFSARYVTARRIF